MRKINRIFATFAISVLAFSSCSETKNSSELTIGFEKDSYSYKESAGLTRIKLVLEGDADAKPVKFDLDVKVISEEGLEYNDVLHFTQTEGLKANAAIDAPVNIEFMVKDNDFVNDNRLVEVSLANVKGGKVSLGKTVIEIKDNDNDPYDKLMGDWVATAYDYNGTKTTFDVNIGGGFTESDMMNNEGRVLVCWGFGAYQREFDGANPPKQPVWYLDFNEDAKKLSVQPNTLMANKFNFSNISYDVIIRCCTIIPGPQISFSIPLEGTWSDDFNTITFQNGGYGLTAAIFTTDGTYTDEVWMIFTDIVLTRKK